MKNRIVLLAALLLAFLLVGCGGGGGRGGQTPTDFQFTTSPDGRQVAFIRYTSTTDPNAADLYVKTANGSNTHRIFDSDWSVQSPFWSPTSDKIFFVHVLRGNKPRLTTIDLTTQQTQELAPMNAIAEQWTLDHKIIFRSGGIRYQINDDGTGLVSLGPI